jgi:hypothetical protein
LSFKLFSLSNIFLNLTNFLLFQIAECDFSFLQTRISPPLVGISLPLVQIKPQQLQLITRTHRHHHPSTLEKKASSHDTREALILSSNRTARQAVTTTTTAAAAAATTTASTRPRHDETTKNSSSCRPCSPDTPTGILANSSSVKSSYSNRDVATPFSTGNTSSSINETTFVSISSTNSRLHPLMRGQAAAPPAQGYTTRSLLPTGAPRLTTTTTVAAAALGHLHEQHRLTHTLTPTPSTPSSSLVDTAAIVNNSNITRPYIKVITLNHHHPPPPPAQQSFRVLKPHASRLYAAAVATTAVVGPVTAPASPRPPPPPTMLTSTVTCRPTSFTTVLMQQQPSSQARPQPHAARQLRSPRTDTRRVAFESSTMTRYASKTTNSTTLNVAKNYKNNNNLPSPTSSHNSTSSSSFSCSNMCSNFYSAANKTPSSDMCSSRNNRLETKTSCTTNHSRGKHEGKCKCCENFLNRMNHNLSNSSSNNSQHVTYGEDGCSYSKYSNVIPVYV